MALYDHEGTRGLAPSSILGQAPKLYALGPGPLKKEPLGLAEAEKK